MEQHGGKGGDVVATVEPSQSQHRIRCNTKNKIHHNHIEQALLHGLPILLSVDLEGRGEGMGAGLKTVEERNVIVGVVRK